MLEFTSMLYRVPALLFAIVVHEYAHAQCADSMGDPTARYMGRLTFNPLAHLDIMGTLMLVLAGFGWAKGVPVNVNNFRDRRAGIIKVALAGPAANLLLCFLAVFLMGVVGALGAMVGVKGDTLYRFLVWVQLYNVWFAFFNLLPIPPLDGSRILCELLPPDMAWKYRETLDRYGFFILIALVCTGISSMIIMPLANGYLTLVRSLLLMLF